jgi:nickel-dependent lactate racemase
MLCQLHQSYRDVPVTLQMIMECGLGRRIEVGMAQIGGAGQVLGAEQIMEFVRERLSAVAVDGRSVCVLVPDGTRTCPLPLLLSAVHGALAGRVSALTVLIALGTHGAMSEPALAAHLGYPAGDLDGRYPGMRVLNHRWQDPAALTTIGTISAARMASLSDGLLQVEVPVRINREVLEHDVALVVGPVFPHEVVGFSGGNKYFFPGVSGQEMINLSHWLGALITSASIIGTRGVTPVRALINEAAAMIPARRLAFCVVTGAEPDSLCSVSFGEPEEAWAAAADVSAQTHVRYLDAPVRRVLSMMPARYDEIWTGAKGFYKVEPVVSDGGQVVIYAPHITRIAAQHPDLLKIGYHCRDYFTRQWDTFSRYQLADLAHSTHLRGAGTFDPATGREDLRVTVTLATGIPEAVVRSVSLDYLDPALVDPAAWAADPGTMVVPDAGEHLFRLRELPDRAG